MRILIKVLVICVLSTVLFLSCGQSRKGESILDNISKTDTTCWKELKKAEIDFEKGRLIYCNYQILLRCENEMTGLLKKFNIDLENRVTSDVIVPGHRDGCYCDYMQEKIDNRFGKVFSDSLLYVADSMYISSHLYEVFDNRSNRSSWDNPPMFPGDTVYDQTNHSGLQKEFEKLVKYPDGYRYTKGENSLAMLQVYLDIDEKGKATVTNTQFVFWDSRTNEEDYNKGCRSYLKNIAISLIEKTTWKPATIKSFNVKSKNDIFIYLE